MQKTTLKVTMENGKVISDMGLLLPCALEELGYETISLTLTRTFGIILTIVYYLSFEQKMLIWLNNTTNIMSLVEANLHPNLYSNSTIIPRNIVENLHLSTRQIVTHFTWLE